MYTKYGTWCFTSTSVDRGRRSGVVIRRKRKKPAYNGSRVGIGLDVLQIFERTSEDWAT